MRNVIEEAVLARLAEKISDTIDYDGIAKSVAPAFKKRIISEMKSQVNEDIDFSVWVRNVFTESNVINEAMEKVAESVAENMVATIAKV